MDYIMMSRNGRQSILRGFQLETCLAVEASRPAGSGCAALYWRSKGLER